jgi:hypothetical protein
MKNQILTRFSLACLAAFVVCFLSSSTFGAATIVIQNSDSPNVGFNDPTPATPVGGNSGTTLGQQRLNAIQFAANLWGATLNSSTTITISAHWESLECGVLAGAGSANIFSGFSGAPFANTWYGGALANALHGSDLAANPEINATFNSSVGTSTCSTFPPFYLGLDNNHGSGNDLITVVLHEFGHGLGFQSFTDETSGAQPSNRTSIFDRFLFDNQTSKTWNQMTDLERRASAINTGHLTWNGANVTSQASSILATPRLRVNTPAGIAGNYTVGTAGFGPSLSFPGQTANLVQSSPNDGCSAITNGAAISGKIALIDRGTCNFTVKVKNAQNVGAIGVVIVNNVSGPPIGMSGSDPTITIPSVMITLADGNTIKAQLGSGVNATIFRDPSTPGGVDASGRPLMYAPITVEEGSSVSHWDVTLFPNQLMEPNINGDLTHSTDTPQDLTAALLRDIGWTIINTTPANTVQFAIASQSLNETPNATAHADVLVTRSGDTSAAATVDYVSANGTASDRSDYMVAIGTLHFAGGETSKTIPVFIVNDSFGEPAETFTLNLTNPNGCTLGSQQTFTVTINSDESANGPNPMKDPSFNNDFFVRQQYVDFFNREAVNGGLNFWKNQLAECEQVPLPGGFPDAQTCREIRRINVSAAFFLSIEFQQTGYLVERLYKVAYGDATGTSTLGGTHTLPVPIVRLNEFFPDTQAIGRGVIIGQPGADQLLENNKQALIAEFVLRSRFLTAFPVSMTAAQFVDKLNQNSGNALSQGERDQLVAELTSGAKSRSQVVRAVAEDSTLFAAETNRAFVLCQFLGYLRRNPNDTPDSDYTGYDFWLGKLNEFGGNFVNAEMVKSFIVSGEYLGRFGP